MKLPKKYLEVLYKVVRDYKTPKMAQGRIRDSLLKMLAEPVDQFVNDRNTIYIQFCDKNEDGTPNIIEDKYKFAPKLIDELNVELKTLGDEEIELTFPSEIKNIIEESSYETLPGETVIIDELIQKI